MAKGDGSIQCLGRDKWRISISAGKDPITGKQRRVTRVVNGSKSEARKARDQIRRELDEGLRLNADKITLRQFCSEFIAAKSTAGKASPQTIERDRARLDFICEFLGDTPLKQIDARTVEALYRKIREKRMTQGRGCGNTTLHAYHVILKAVMAKAVAYDLILRNPCERVEAPSIDKVERKALTVKEAAKLMQEVDKAENEALKALAAKEQRQAAWGVSEDRSYLLGMRDVCYLLAVRIALASGMRLGEVLAVTWGAVDFSRGSITVRQSLDAKSKPKAPKTAAGFRTVAIDAQTMAHLMRWRSVQAELLDCLMLTTDSSTPALCSATGDYLNKDNFGRWWREFRKEVGFPALKFHELRHTQATQLLANGMDVKTVQSRLGHAKAAITMDFYAHAVPENDKKAARLIGGLFNEKPKAISAKKSA